MVVAGDDVVDVCCAHVACRVVPPVCPSLCLSTGGWWGGYWVEACAFVVCFCECLFSEFVPVCWQALTAVGCGPWHVCQGTWWGVGGGVVGGWVGSWFRGVVSGGGWVLWLGCLVGGGVCVVGPGVWLAGGVTCGGLFPLDPSLTPAPIRLVGCGSWFGPSLCWVVQAVCWWVSCGLQFFSDGVGWSGGWLVLRVVSWLGCSSREGRGCGSRWLSGSAACSLGLFPGWGLRGLCSLSGGCSQACGVAPVGRADLDGRALRRPPLSPPTVHDNPSQTPKSGGRTHTLKR